MNEPEHYGSSRAWSWRHAVGKSGLPPMTRLVLHTLGLKMDATGGSCYPSIADLVDLTGLDKKTVMKHLDIAEEKGWIAVSQHGFRGQKWKRNEYVARWPGRDLVGEAANSSENEGGGAVPPRSTPEKVVEMVPEGGGNDAQKVVEQFHQDKTLPENIPTNSPAAGAAREGSKADLKKISRDFTIWYASWEKGDEGFARNTWSALSAEDRAECIRRTPDVLKQVPKSERVAAAVFLKARGWTEIPELPPESERTVLHNAFSKAWSARRFAELLRDPAAPPVPTAFQQAELRKGGDAAEAINRERRLRYGWPRVITIHQRAEQAEGITVPPWLVRISEGFVPHHRDSDMTEQWRLLHERNGWPWLPEKMDWLFFPAGDPEEAMIEFRDAVARERSNDDAA